MESFDDIIKRGDEKRAGRDQEEDRRLGSARARLDELAASLEQSVDMALKAMATSMPSLQVNGIERASAVYKNGVVQTTVLAKAHTEYVDIDLAVQLGAQPGDGINLGLMHVGELRGTVVRRGVPGGRKEPFAYKFSEDIIVTPRCGVDAMTLQFNLGQVIKRLVA